MYEPASFVEPLGYQPVEFLDLPPMSETRASQQIRPIRTDSNTTRLVTPIESTHLARG
jgi:hypothetical protein